MARQTLDLQAIEQATERLLLKADVRDRLPTPIDDIVAAAGLTEPAESLLSGSVIDQAPAHLRRVMRKLKFKVEAVLDRKTREVHLAPSVDNQGRIGFKKLHEVTHHILDWQTELAYADDLLTLSPAISTLFEREANQGAAELFFQRTLFADMAATYDIGVGAIQDLANQFGASFHASFRRFIESHGGHVMGLVLEPSPCSDDGRSYRRKEAVCSKKWAKRFGTGYAWPKEIRDPPFSFVKLASQARLAGLTQTGAIALVDLTNTSTSLSVEVYFNQYSLFVLMWVPRKRVAARRRVIAVPGG